LLDFGKQSLAWKRLIFTSKDATLREVTPPSFVTEPDLGRGVLRVVSECLQQIGLGYKESTWKGLVRASLQAAGYKVLTSPMVQVLEHPPKSLSSLVVKNTCALLTVALGNRIQAADRAVLQTHLRWLNLSWGVVLHFGKTSADECFVKSRDKGRSVLENQSCWETNVVLVNSQGYHQVMVESVQESRLGTVLGRHSCNGHISWGKSRSHDVSHPSARYVGG
jgi:hypothetical protein